LAGASIVFWDASSGEELLSFAAFTGTSAIALSSDGSTLAAATSDGIVIWEVNP
jgi:hypothetical protein